MLDLLDGIVESGRPVAANRALTAIRKLFNWAVERDIIASSPCAGVKPPTPEQSRDRVLSDDELGNVWRAADQLGGPFVALVKLLRDRPAARRGRAHDLERSRFGCPAVDAAERAQQKRPATRHPVERLAISILASLPRIGDSFVLTTDGNVASSNYSPNKRRLDTLRPADMPAWRLHDLRRTAASGMARLGISLPVIERVSTIRAAHSPALSAFINASTFPRKNATRSIAGGRISLI